MKPIQTIRQAMRRGLVSYLVAPISAAHVAQARDDLRSLLQPGDVILVKGSRSARMERVAEELERLTDSGRGGD